MRRKYGRVHRRIFACAGAGRFACDVGKDGAQVCSSRAKWREEIWRKMEFVEEVVCPLPVVEVKGKGARGEGIVGGGYAR